MRICFFRSDKPREGLLAEAFIEGVRQHGDDGEIRLVEDWTTNVAHGCEVACMIAVKSRDSMRANIRAGINVVYFDKGYLRHRAPGPVRLWEYWRVALNAHHPTRTLMDVSRPRDRMKKCGMRLAEWRETGEHIIFAGSSAKYHEFYGLPSPEEYAEKVISRLRKMTQREIIYRPKQTYKEAVPVKGSTFSLGRKTIDEELRGAHAVVTHGSNACFEAVCFGVPCIVLGDAVAKPISSTALEDIEEPHLADRPTRKQWLANLAYHQWTLAEFASGEAWAVIRPQIFGSY